MLSPAVRVALTLVLVVGALAHGLPAAEATAPDCTPPLPSSVSVTTPHVEEDACIGDDNGNEPCDGKEVVVYSSETRCIGI